jgi:hypothetical protein
VVQALQHKLASRQTGWQRTAQRTTMVALYESIKHEKRGDYLFKNEKLTLAARKYQQSLRMEQRILGEDHPLVVSLAQKNAIAKPSAEVKTLTAVKSLTTVKPSLNAAEALTTTKTLTTAETLASDKTMPSCSSVLIQGVVPKAKNTFVWKIAKLERHDVAQPLTSFEKRIITPMAA